jgi:hypothetical protein
MPLEAETAIAIDPSIGFCNEPLLGAKYAGTGSLTEFCGKN